MAVRLAERRPADARTLMEPGRVGLAVAGRHPAGPHRVAAHPTGRHHPRLLGVGVPVDRGHDPGVRHAAPGGRLTLCYAGVCRRRGSFPFVDKNCDLVLVGGFSYPPTSMVACGGQAALWRGPERGLSVRAWRGCS